MRFTTLASIHPRGFVALSLPVALIVASAAVLPRADTEVYDNKICQMDLTSAAVHCPSAVDCIVNPAGYFCQLAPIPYACLEEPDKQCVDTTYSPERPQYPCGIQISCLTGRPIIINGVMVSCPQVPGDCMNLDTPVDPN